MNDKPYDFVIAGGGVAGLSLAYHLAQSQLRNRSILIIDREAKDLNDLTLSFWTDQPTLFDTVVYRSWCRFRVASDVSDKIIDLGNYRYKTIRGIDFYRFVKQALSAYSNVTFLQGTVESIEDSENGATVTVDGQPYTGHWVFSSLFKIAAFEPDPDACYLQQYFKGWVIETKSNAFDPQMATFMDFRTPQQGELRFFYVLPFSRRRALVEYVWLSREHGDGALRAYIEDVLEIKKYRILEKEGGASPLCDQPFPRRTGRHVMTIGAKGGRIKPSTGYAFMRIQHDSAAIVRSLLKAGHPFDVPESSWLYRLCDAIMLRIMAHRGAWLKPLMVALFEHNPAGRIFRFLDEIGLPWDNLPLMASVVPPFLELALPPKVIESELKSVFG